MNTVKESTVSRRLCLFSVHKERERLNEPLLLSIQTQIHSAHREYEDNVFCVCVGELIIVHSLTMNVSLRVFLHLIASRMHIHFVCASLCVSKCVCERLQGETRIKEWILYSI